MAIVKGLQLSRGCPLKQGLCFPGPCYSPPLGAQPDEKVAQIKDAEGKGGTLSRHTALPAFKVYAHLKALQISSFQNFHPCKISCMKRVASPGSMHDTGCVGLVHWDDPEGWSGEGGGRRVQDGAGMLCKETSSPCLNTSSDGALTTSRGRVSSRREGGTVGTKKLPVQGCHFSFPNQPGNGFCNS